MHLVSKQKLEEKIQVYDLIIQDCPKQDPLYREYVDYFLTLQIKYKKLYGDYYGRHKVTMNKK